MKILTVVYNLDKGGTQRAAQVFAEAYKELGHDSRVLSLYGLGGRYKELKGKINVWDTLLEGNLSYIEKWHPDVIHIHSHGPKEIDINQLLNNLPTSKIIETNVFSTPSPWAKRVDVSFQLTYWANWIFNLRGGIKYKSAIVPYAVNCNAFKKANMRDIGAFKKEHKIPQGAFIMGRIGQSFPGKWSPMLLRVFNALAKNEKTLYLLVINAPENILDLIDASPYKDRIIYIPKILGDNNLSTAYSAMDVMTLIAEQGESFGMVLAESILCETPVVALSTPWADNSQCEVVGNKVGGYIANTERGIKEAITLLLNKKDSLNIKKHGISYINKKFNYLNVAKQALESLVDTSKLDLNKNHNVLDILKDSIDKPNNMTLFFLKMNNDVFRRLTIYSASYKGWFALMIKFFIRIFGK